MLVRLQEMEVSPQIYNVDIFEDPFQTGEQDGHMKLGMIFRHNEIRVAVNIKLHLTKGVANNKARKYGLFAHEFTHGSQYERRLVTLDFNEETDHRTLGLEIEAYQMQFYYGQLRDSKGYRVTDINSINGQFVLDRGYGYLSGTSESIMKPMTDDMIQGIYETNLEIYRTTLNKLKQSEGWVPENLHINEVPLIYYRGWKEDMLRQVKANQKISQ